MTRLKFEAVHVGDALPPLELPAITRTTLALFAGASGDHNQIHIDIDYARQAGMTDVFAHGMLSMAYLGRLLTQWVDQRQLRQFGVRFTGITHLGHRIACTGRVVEKFEAGGEQRARLEIQTANQYGETKILGDAVIAFQS
ncbi:MaoC family dehydratase [Variovorax saccharolyticus]|uniref:MaoC family dehydratase n=1 Tax=Variovorax saccharolyticus TaxID=3053516 RepID=UPI002578EE28|nr:MaoC family dehydratase [Variovorax sp. J22R187]MDM0021108.1 MaoC family dehydratase [Variovorax sp. J22R187]